MDSLLLLSGSTRARSVNTALLRAVASEAPGHGFNPQLDLSLRNLPQFDPDVDTTGEVPAEVEVLRDRAEAAAAVMCCAPEYAGALPGAAKNVFDWCVTRGLYRAPVAWLNASSRPGGADHARDELRRVAGYLEMPVVEGALGEVRLSHRDVDGDGVLTDDALTRARPVITAALEALRTHVDHRPRTTD